MADDEEKQLSALFEELGARDADGWARSQIQEGIPQLARYLFLRQAWRNVIPADVGAAANHWHADAPEFRKLLAAGVPLVDLVALVRKAQRSLLFSLCYLMDDPNIAEAEVEAMDWGLFQIDADGRPGARISGLHESVLETDPECPE